MRQIPSRKRPSPGWWSSVKAEMVLAACLVCCCGIARAQAPAADAPASSDIEQRLAAQEARLREQDARLREQDAKLRQQDARLQTQEARARERDKALGQRILGLGPDGFALGTRESGFQLRLRGVIQADGRAFFGTGLNQPLPDQFLIRRARIILEGTIGDFVDFRILPEFGQGNFQLLDAYVDLRPWKWLALRGGKYKTPFGLERLQQEQFLLFVERGLPQNLVPDRDIGATLHGNVGDGLLLYEAGVFNGTVDGGNVDGDNNDGKDWVFRVFGHPFRRLRTDAIRNFGIGFAATYGKQRGTIAASGLPQLKTTGQNTFFTFLADPTGVKPTIVALGDRYRLSPQLYYYAGPVGLLAEYVYSATTVTAYNSGTQTLLANQAWQVQASVVVTGEHASYEGVQPRRPFNLRQRHFGALELAARYGELRVDNATFPAFADPTKSARAALEWAVQGNWHFTRLVKFALLFARTTFKGGAPMGGERVPENALMGRLQVAF
ncbi:MAG: oprP [bacterium]|nr:oprP [bacterium]